MSPLRWLRTVAITLLLLLLLIIILIASGQFDPQPISQLSQQHPPQELVIPPNSQQIRLLERPLPPPPYSIRLTAALQSGALDSGYGLLLGTEARHFAVAVSPLGTLAVWETSPQINFLLPWQTWPHVRLADDANEIWLDVADDQMTVRINRELLWSGVVGNFGGDMMLWGESWGDTAVVDYQSIQYFVTP